MVFHSGFAIERETVSISKTFVVYYYSYLNLSTKLTILEFLSRGHSL